jgi:hypothetical protein
VRLPPPRTGLVAAGGAVFLVALVLAPLQLGDGADPGEPPTGGTSADARADRDGAAGQPDERASQNTSPGRTQTTSRPADRSGRGENVGATSGEAGTEAEAGEVGGLPGLSSLTGPPPGSHRVITAAPRSLAVERSRSSDGDRVHVTLTASRSSSAVSVLRHYRIRLGRLGFEEVPVPTAAGSVSAAFRRAGSSVTVSVTPRAEGGVGYAVIGTLGPRGS